MAKSLWYSSQQEYTDEESSNENVSSGNTPSKSVGCDMDSCLQDYRSKIYSVAVLLTGSVEDAEEVVDEVFKTVCSEGHLAKEAIESLIHRLTYDASLAKLLEQVDNRAAELEETSSKILDIPTYLC